MYNFSRHTERPAEENPLSFRKDYIETFPLVNIKVVCGMKGEEEEAEERM